MRNDNDNSNPINPITEAAIQEAISENKNLENPTPTSSTETKEYDIIDKVIKENTLSQIKKEQEEKAKKDYETRQRAMVEESVQDKEYREAQEKQKKNFEAELDDLFGKKKENETLEEMKTRLEKMTRFAKVLDKVISDKEKYGHVTKETEKELDEGLDLKNHPERASKKNEIMKMSVEENKDFKKTVDSAANELKNRLNKILEKDLELEQDASKEESQSKELDQMKAKSEALEAMHRANEERGTEEGKISEGAKNQLKEAVKTQENLKQKSSERETGSEKPATIEAPSVSMADLKAEVMEKLKEAKANKSEIDRELQEKIHTVMNPGNNPDTEKRLSTMINNHNASVAKPENTLQTTEQKPQEPGAQKSQYPDGSPENSASDAGKQNFREVANMNKTTVQAEVSVEKGPAQGPMQINNKQQTKSSSGRDSTPPLR